MLKEINLARADLNLLTLFEVILRERHVGRAAIQLNLTSSAVSHGLGRLRRLLNDPLFLRTPKGVVPTARAVALAEPVADLLAQARNVLASAAPFDPATSTRRFVIGAPDGSVFLKPLLAVLRDRAPGIDIGMRQLMPPQGGHSVERAWTPVFASWKQGRSISPSRRSIARRRASWPAPSMTRISSRWRVPAILSLCGRRLQRFCQSQHLVVSMHRGPVRLRRCRTGGAGARPPCRAHRAGFCHGTCGGGGNRFDCGDATAFRGHACRALCGGEQGAAVAVADIFDSSRRAQGRADGRRPRLAVRRVGRGGPGRRGAKAKRRAPVRSAS